MKKIIKSVSDKELALTFWKSRSDAEKERLLKKYFPWLWVNKLDLQGKVFIYVNEK